MNFMYWVLIGVAALVGITEITMSRFSPGPEEINAASAPDPRSQAH